MQCLGGYFIHNVRTCRLHTTSSLYLKVQSHVNALENTMTLHNIVIVSKVTLCPSLAFVRYLIIKTKLSRCLHSKYVRPTVVSLPLSNCVTIVDTLILQQNMLSFHLRRQCTERILYWQTHLFLSSTCEHHRIPCPYAACPIPTQHLTWPGNNRINLQNNKHGFITYYNMYIFLKLHNIQAISRSLTWILFILDTPILPNYIRFQQQCKHRDPGIVQVCLK